MRLRTYGIGIGVVILGGVAAQTHGGLVRSAVAAPSHQTKTLHIRESNGQYGFVPTRLTVKTGTKVTWVNNSDAPHTVSGTKGWHFASSMFSQNHSVSYTFTKAGTYHYYCAVHPYMKATVVVQK